MVRNIAIGLALLAVSSLAAVRADEPLAKWSVCFTPRDTCATHMVREVEAAKKTVLVQAYHLTSARLAKALVQTQKRGVEVRIMLDRRGWGRSSVVDVLAHSGVPIWVGSCCAVTRQQVLIIDGETLVTGTFSAASTAQETSSENLLVLRSRELAMRYAANWEEHLGSSQRYQGRSSGVAPRR
jgi:phosphatidylserine/phosphatidylglycerophosphate/cardiolipin synthase-like enzyme